MYLLVETFFQHTTKVTADEIFSAGHMAANKNRTWKKHAGCFRAPPVPPTNRWQNKNYYGIPPFRLDDCHQNTL